MSHSSSAAALGVVDTTCRLAQWRIHNVMASNRKSQPFRIGNWNWHISVEEKNRMLNIRLYPVVISTKEIIYPIASFIIKAIVFSPQGARKAFTHPEVTDKLLKNSDDFVWAIDISLLTGKLIIDVEFLDLKTSSPTIGGEPSSIWADGHPHNKVSNAAPALSTLSRMLTEAIYTDITINASDGSIGAHRAVLASRSPVFRTMFSHDNLKETQLSAINISDMSLQSCRAFLNYIYGGNLKPEEFITHRLALVRAADKYDITDLKDACHKSLIEDINSMNVLERLRISYMYRLPDLKSRCMLYLFKFGKVYDIQDQLNAFLRSADRDIITDIFYEILSAWKGF